MRSLSNASPYRLKFHPFQPMPSTEVILNSRCANSTVILLNQTNSYLQFTKESRASAASRRAAHYQRPCETSLIYQSLQRTRLKSRTAAEKIARSSTRRCPISTKMEAQRTATRLHRPARLHRKVTRIRFRRRSPSCVCCYDRSNTVRITYRRSESSLNERVSSAAVIKPGTL